MREFLRRIARRLFFYSSRQLFRRKRIYLSVFITSLVLMTVAMTSLEVYELNWLRKEEINPYGNYHAKIVGWLYNCAGEIREDSTVRDAWSIRWSSRLASSEDASLPGRISVENETTNRALNVSYIWGHPPGNGEIAVTDALYSSVNWLEAGEVNDLWFSASKMTYFPLTVSGIFTVNDPEADFVFVSEDTARQIDAETGAVEKYDIFFTCDYNSDRYVAKTFDRLWHKLRLTETDYQTLSPFDRTSTMRLVQKYGQYINTRKLASQVAYSATPVVIEVLPIIAAAALILAVFMTNWTKTNAPEFGILGAIGANRRQLCAISAGQILLITLIVTPPVILVSALLSLIYVTAFNRAVVGIGYTFTVPWINLLKSALWFDALSTLFTYLGIAAMTREPPFVLISGSWRGKLPFVRRSSRALERVKDKVARLALLETFRQIGGEIVHGVIAGLLALVLSHFIIEQIDVTSNAAQNIANIGVRYVSDTEISVKTERSGDIGAHVSIPLTLADEVRETDGVAVCGAASMLEYWGHDILNDNAYRDNRISSDIYGTWQGVSVEVTDRDALPFLIGAVREGDPDALFDDPFAAVLIAGPGSRFLESEMTGVEFGVLRSLIYRKSSTKDQNGMRTYEPEVPDEVPTFHVAAVVSRPAGSRHGDIILLNPEGADRAGLISKDECWKLYLKYDEGLTEEEGRALTEKLSHMPALLRYDVKNARYLTDSERGLEKAGTYMNTLLLVMLFLAFCVMTYMNSSMKTARSRREFAVERQLGASDADIYKQMRVGTYPSAVIAFLLDTVVMLGFVVFYILTAMAELNIQADIYPLTYTPEFYAKCRMEIFSIVPPILQLYVISLLPQIPMALAAVLGTVIPTRRLLKEPVTEGLRRDTD